MCIMVQVKDYNGREPTRKEKICLLPSLILLNFRKIGVMLSGYFLQLISTLQLPSN